MHHNSIAATPLFVQDIRLEKVLMGHNLRHGRSMQSMDLRQHRECESCSSTNKVLTRDATHVSHEELHDA